jgi:selenide, water dikinase
LLVGLIEADDAAVVKLDGLDALVLTLDFFSPVVDDAFTWGQIAAANAVSDVYAMGGRPLVALNIAGWPRETLPLELLGEVLKGGLEVAGRAGFAVVGGHTVDDPEPKYGMAVVGRADPSRLMTIDAAETGDDLVLTKSIGTGVITTALKAEAAPAEAIDAAVASMTELNDEASRALVAAGVRACTDVTGFGLVGHLGRMLAASGVAAEIDASAVPLLPGALELARAGHVPGGTRRNIDAATPTIEWNGADETSQVLLCDAQTSGGLLAACRDAPVGTRIGRIVDGAPGRISVRGSVG